MKPRARTPVPRPQRRPHAPEPAERAPDPAAPRPLVTFTSDFGYADWFVGVVHGVVHEICPEARIVDLTHEIPPGHVERASFVLEAACPDFPAGTVHLAVVDPGVGTARHALAVRARGQLFVGPDNGILEWGLSDPDAEVRRLTEERWFRHPVSRTFHGRDVFAPVAAHLARGLPLSSFGPPLASPVRTARPPVRPMDGELAGCVMLVDRFGNALTNLTAASLATAFAGVPEEALVVRIGSRSIRGLARSYGDAPIGTLLAIVGSSGRLEIAQVGGNAATRFGFGEGDPVMVSAR
ncbi:MAG TPA: SAM-dependent chlorinase/fluorinase [Candidatus Eisenbacteria bacterium]